MIGRLLVLGLAGKALTLLIAAPEAQAFEVAAGFGAVEEGDDRIRPGLGLHMGFNDFYAARIHFYGREFGPVREETYIASFQRRWGLFKSNTVTAGFGMAVMDERTKLTFEDDAEAESETEDNYNVGAVMGISWSLPKTSSPLFASVSWDSHIFPAGMGGLLLSTGRKQTITLLIGAQIK